MPGPEQLTIPGVGIGGNDEARLVDDGLIRRKPVELTAREQAVLPPFELVIHHKLHPTTVEFLRILEEVGHLSIRKGKDYGSNEDPDANLQASEDFGIPAWKGCISRANDKMRRLMRFAKDGELENESAEDAFADLGVYAFKALRFYRRATSAA